MSKRKQHALEFKAKVALEALKGYQVAILAEPESGVPIFYVVALPIQHI